MKVRELNAEEFPRLEAIADGYTPDPKSSIAFVAEDDNRIVARIFLLSPTHIEGPWIEEERRGGTLAARLVGSAAERARKIGITRLFAYAVNEQIEDYLSRLGFRQSPMTVWEKEL